MSISQTAALNLSFDKLHVTIEDVNMAQSAASPEDIEYAVTDDGFTYNEQGLITHDGKVVIPHDDNLRVRLLAMAHQGLQGHRGQRATIVTLASLFSWKDLHKDVATFINSCLHCVPNTGPVRIPRPLGRMAHSDRINGLIHMDYLYMRDLSTTADHDYKYVLVVKDDCSSYTMLYPAVNADAATTVDCLLDWFMRFGVVRRWYSDGGSHFVNQWVRLLAQTLRVNHHITTAYSPTANGAVEVVNRLLLRAMRSLLSEFRMHTSHWPRLLPIVNSTLNSTPSERLGGFSPFRVFLGRDPDSPLHAVFDNSSSTITDTSSTDTIANALYDVSIALEDFHGTGMVHSPRPSPAATKGALANFDIGDFVFVADIHRHDKLRPYWRGPYVVTATVNPHVFTVTNIVDDKDVRDVDSRQLRLYAFGTDLTISEEIRQQARHDNHGHVIDRIVSHKPYPRSSDFRIFLHWDGDEDVSEEPLSHLGPQVPDLMRRYIKSVSNATERAKLTRSLDMYLKPRKAPAKDKPKPAAGASLRPKSSTRRGGKRPAASPAAASPDAPPAAPAVARQVPHAGAGQPRESRRLRGHSPTA